MLPTPGNKKIDEASLQHLALYVLYQANKFYQRPVETKVLRVALENALKNLKLLGPEDEVPLKNRTDFGYQQRIRNLISHGTLEKAGWVKRHVKTAKDAVLAEGEKASLGGLEVTSKGRDELLNVFDAYAPTPDFDALMAAENAKTKTQSNKVSAQPSKPKI